MLGGNIVTGILSPPTGVVPTAESKATLGGSNVTQGRPEITAGGRSRGSAGGTSVPGILVDLPSRQPPPRSPPFGSSRTGQSSQSWEIVGQTTEKKPQNEVVAKQDAGPVTFLKGPAGPPQSFGGSLTNDESERTVDKTRPRPTDVAAEFAEMQKQRKIQRETIAEQRAAHELEEARQRETLVEHRAIEAVAALRQQ